MGLNNDTLQNIQSQAVQAAGVTCIHKSADGRKQVFFNHAAGETFTEACDPECRKHHVHDLTQLIALATDWKKSHDTPMAAWYSSEGVILLLDDRDRRDRATFKLTPSPQWTVLQNLANGNSDTRMAQQNFIRLLHRTLEVPTSVTAPFRSLSWEVVRAAEGVHHHGEDRVGKSVQAKVKGTNEIPESIEVTVPVFAEPGERGLVPVELGVDLLIEQSAIQCQPLPGRMEAGVDDRLASIFERLEVGMGDFVNIYHGTP